MANQLAQENNSTTNAPAVQQQRPAPAKTEESALEAVLSKVQELTAIGALALPKDFSAENALRFAWLTLLDTVDRNNKPALEVCTRPSIMNALLSMVISGLSPAKKQGYFIVYGNELAWEESYFGALAIAKRDADVKDVNANVVYQDDDFEYEIDVTTAKKKVLIHKQKLANIDVNKIVGAYAIVLFNDGSTKTEIMTMTQIRQSWQQGATKGNSPAHQKFPDQMALRTVLRRAIKIDINSSDDSELALRVDPVTASAHQQIREHANKIPITMNGAAKNQQPEARTNEDDSDIIQPENEHVQDAGNNAEANTNGVQQTFGGPGF